MAEDRDNTRTLPLADSERARRSHEAGGTSEAASDSTLRDHQAPRPRRIGDYRIVRKLGEGGMGMVFEAEQQRPRRPVALKVIRSGGFVSETHVKLFEREAQTLARLKHPGIAAIYESGRTPDGQHFFAMELVRGATLSESLRHHDPGDDELRRRLTLFQKICAAVSYAHQRGVIHRDLKPSNILVLRESSERTLSGDGSAAPDVKILDFGLARLIDSDPAASAITELGNMQGTLPYMSPEQIRANPDEIDLRSDVYSLGVILYEMLTGERPHDLESLPLPEAAQRIRDTAPRPFRVLGADQRRVDADLETITLKALEKEPAQRYQSASALADDVARYLASQPILARPPSTLYQLRKLMARHKVVVAFAASLVVLLALFAISMAVLASRIAHERDRANQEAESAVRVADFLVGLFEVSDPSEAKGNAVTARELLDAGAQEIPGLEEQPLVQARLMDTMGRVYGSLGLYRRALPLLERSLAIRRAQLRPGHADLRRSLDHTADAMLSASRFEEAERLYLELLAERREQLGAEHAEVADSLTDLSTLYWRRGNYGEAREHIERSLAILERGGGENASVADTLSRIAALDYTMGDYEAAESRFRRVLAIREGLVDPLDPVLAVDLNNLAIALNHLGRFDEARSLFERVLAIQQRTLDAGHPSLAVALNNLADLERAAGRPEAARPLLERAIHIREQAMGPSDAELARFLTNLGWVLRLLGEREDARTYLERGLRIREEVLGPRHIDTAWGAYHLGLLEKDEEDYGEAEAMLRRSVAIFEELSPDATFLPGVLETFAECLEAQGKNEEASSVRKELARS